MTQLGWGTPLPRRGKALGEVKARISQSDAKMGLEVHAPSPRIQLLAPARASHWFKIIEPWRTEPEKLQLKPTGGGSHGPIVGAWLGLWWELGGWWELQTVKVGPFLLLPMKYLCENPCTGVVAALSVPPNPYNSLFKNRCPLPSGTSQSWPMGITRGCGSILDPFCLPPMGLPVVWSNRLQSKCWVNRSFSAFSHSLDPSIVSLHSTPVSANGLSQALTLISCREPKPRNPATCLKAHAPTVKVSWGCW